MNYVCLRLTFMGKQSPCLRAFKIMFVSLLLGHGACHFLCTNLLSKITKSNYVALKINRSVIRLSTYSIEQEAPFLEKETNFHD